MAVVEFEMDRPAIKVARCLQDVIACWRLVYRTYLDAGLIDANTHEVYTVPHAVQPKSAVFFGKVGEEVAFTMSAYHDGPSKLPLDSVYPNELNRLRAEGRSLLEVGLFADRRREVSRQLDMLLELMRHATHFGLQGGSRDAVVGVHPRHAPFYRRMLGFERIGSVRDHPGVNGALVTLLHLDWTRFSRSSRRPAAIAAFKAQPVSKRAFSNRYAFEAQEVAGSVVGLFLSERYHPVCRKSA